MTDPVDFLLRAAMRLPRPAIERLAEGIIAELDALDGDADLEDDDPSGNMTEMDLSPRHLPVRDPASAYRWIKPE